MSSLLEKLKSISTGLLPNLKYVLRIILIKIINLISKYVISFKYGENETNHYKKIKEKIVI